MPLYAIISYLIDIFGVINEIILLEYIGYTVSYICPNEKKYIYYTGCCFRIGTAFTIKFRIIEQNNNQITKFG